MYESVIFYFIKIKIDYETQKKFRIQSHYASPSGKSESSSDVEQRGLVLLSKSKSNSSSDMRLSSDCSFSAV